MTHRSPHVARLVEAMVDARLGGFLEFREFVYEDDANRPSTGTDIDDLIDALELLPRSAREAVQIPQTFRQFRDQIYHLNDDAEDLFIKMRDAAVEAGYLLGLELGKRLGRGR